MNFRLLASAFILIVFINAGCRKDKESNEILLQNKSGLEIRNLIVGKWQIHYSYGGPLGQTYTPCNNCYWDITATDSLYETYDGSLFKKGRFKLEKNSDNQWVILDYEPGSGYAWNWSLLKLKEDTLICRYNTANFATSYMTKQ